MLYILVSCVSFILLSKALSNYKPEFPAEDREMVSSSHWLRWKISCLLTSWFSKSRFLINIFRSSVTMSLKKKILGPKVKNGEGEETFSLLDLPELTLEYIIEHLSPAGLCTMSAVCTSLRDRCRSDHLWEKHWEKKWAPLIGDAAYRQWQSSAASRQREKFSDQCNQTGLWSSLVGAWSVFWSRVKSEEGGRLLKSSNPNDSVMALYLSLESGKLSFPAQVYNRENGHAGFLLSCYDAQVTYDCRTDTFLARYSPHGGWATEENIHWNRLRKPPIVFTPHDLYISDCYDLKPGDHIEIQWRKNKEFPFGWWYGIVGHLETCHGDQNHCYCCFSDTVILEFNQYKAGSRWRQAIINRRNHREHGNASDGFYGGIRKLEGKQEIEKWKSFLQSA